MSGNSSLSHYSVFTICLALGALYVANSMDVIDTHSLQGQALLIAITVVMVVRVLGVKPEVTLRCNCCGEPRSEHAACERCGMSPEEQATPLCPRCLRRYDRFQHYCECGEAVGTLTTYIPFVNIPFNYSLFQTIWKQLWFDAGPGRVLKIAMVAFLLGCGLFWSNVFFFALFGVPFAIHQRRRDVEGKRTSIWTNLLLGMCGIAMGVLGHLVMLYFLYLFL